MSHTRLPVILLMLIASPHLMAAETSRPNVLFIAVDDLNDWVGCLGGHPQARTPNIDRLASRGTLFTNAHCQAPICNPSRISLMTSVLPSTSGVYYLGPLLRNCESTRNSVTIPQHLARNGYKTIGAGKLFHQQDEKEFQQYGGRFGGFGPRPPKPLSAGHTHPLWDWGAFPALDEQMADAKIAAWTVEQLSRQTVGQPFFLACGFYRPHVPMFAPQKWFDLFPLESVELPAHRDDDLDDVPRYAQDLSWSAVAPRHRWMVEHNEWRHAVQAYLASVAYVDAQVGKVLAALDSSPHAKNTIVVLWTDHGFHLGTKERWGKRSLWEDSTKVALAISTPDHPARRRCHEPVGLIDLFPTLNELCGLDSLTGVEGHSIVPLLEDSATDWPYPAVTTFGQYNHSIRSRHWRYTVYADGSEELYDHRTDDHEFQNLAATADFRREHAAIIAEHRRWLPQVNHPMAPGSHHADARPGSAAEIEPDRIKNR